MNSGATYTAIDVTADATSDAFQNACAVAGCTGSVSTLPDQCASLDGGMNDKPMTTMVAKNCARIKAIRVYTVQRMGFLLSIRRYNIKKENLTNSVAAA